MRTLVGTPDMPESGRRRSPNAGRFPFSPDDTARWQLIVGNSPKREVELDTWEALIANHPPDSLRRGLWQKTAQQSNAGRFGGLEEVVPSSVLQKLVNGIGALPLRGDHDKYTPAPLASEDELGALPPEQRTLPRRTPMASQAAEEPTRATTPGCVEYMQRLAAQQTIVEPPSAAAESP